MLCPFDCPELQDAAPFIWSVDSVALGMLLFNSVALISRTLYHFISLTCSKSLGDRLVAIRYCDTRNNSLRCPHQPFICSVLGPGMGTRRLLEMEQSWRLILTHMQFRIHDIVDLAAKHRNAIHGYEPVPTQHEGWMDGGSG